MRDQVSAGVLSMGHARALLSLDQEAAISRAATDVVSRGLSVRETEAMVKRMLAGPPPPRPQKQADVHTRAAEQELRLALGTPVRIVRKRKGGTIEDRLRIGGRTAAALRVHDGEVWRQDSTSWTS